MNQWRGNSQWRNLAKSELGGVIFGCTKHTFKECMSKQLFGLPQSHIAYVQKIDVGLPLFLFNYSDRKLHGIFEAAGPGQLNIDPYGWTSNGCEKTSYPAQVRISVRLQCEPLTEDKFKPTIEGNYYNNSHHFYFELDQHQTNKLKCLLTSFAVKPKPPPVSSTSYRIKKVFNFPLPSSETKEITMPSMNEPVVGSSENHPEVQNSKQLDKDSVLEKLKHLALAQEHDGDDSLMKTVEETDISNSTCKNLEDKDTLEEETSSEPKESENSLVSSPRQPTISELMQEVKELKAYRLENSMKMSYLEEKLDEANKEISRLREQWNMSDSLNVNADFNDDDSPEDVDDSTLDPNEEILLFGGYNADSDVWLSSVQSYFPSSNVVKPHSTMNYIRSNAAMAKLDGKIYIFGGDDGTRHKWYYDSVESYNQSDGKWSLCPSLTERKMSLGGATLNGKIFAIGGGNVEGCFSDVEMFDPDIGRWIKTRSMEQKRFAVASLEHNGSIYAVGGFDGTNYLNTAERFDPREHSWMKIASMKSKRGCHSLVVLNEKLYAIGGYDYDESKMVSSVEIYEPRRGIWIDGEAMKDFKGFSAAVVVKDSIYVIGGHKGDEEKNILDTVECFKEDGEGWRNVRCSSIGKRCYLSAMVAL